MFGGFFASWQIANMPDFVSVMAAFYLSAARQEEKKFLNSSLADSYRRYRKSTGMFFPLPNLNPQQTDPTP